MGMRTLLDTHLMLWWLTGDPQLPKRAGEFIEDDENEVYVSAASIWEVAIKSALGRIEGNVTEIEAALESSGFLPLPVNGKHAVQVSKLPLHHHDPFDRMLVAQSLVEPMRLLTHDKILAKYGETVILV
jgi:PIN domain nuclease of toxin-antitoxin system